MPLSLSPTVKKWSAPHVKYVPGGTSALDNQSVRGEVEKALDCAPAELAPLARKLKAWIADPERFSARHDEETQLAAFDVFARVPDRPDFIGGWLAAFGLPRTVRLMLHVASVKIGGYPPNQTFVALEPNERFVNTDYAALLIDAVSTLPASERARVTKEDPAWLEALSPSLQLLVARIAGDQALIDDLARRAADDTNFATRIQQAYCSHADMTMLLAVARDAGAVEKLVTQVGWVLYGRGWGLSEALAHVPLDVMKRALLTTLPLAAKRAKGNDYTAHVQVLACIDDSEVAGVIARQATSKGLVRVVHEYFQRLPHHLGVLEAAAKERGKAADAARTIFDTLNRKVQGQVSALAEEDEDEGVPAVLLSPPFEAASKDEEPLDLPIPDEPATHLRPGAFADKKTWHYASIVDIPSLREFMRTGGGWLPGDWLEAVMSRLGPASVPLVVELAGRLPAKNLDLLLHVVSPRAMALLATMLSKSEHLPAIRAHMLAHRDVAIAGLVPAATSKDKKLRAAARSALDLLGAGAMDGKLAQPGKLPPFADAASLPAPIVAKTGKPLPRTAVANLLAILSVLPKDKPHPIASEIKAACTPQSLDSFVWTLLSDFVLAGASSRYDWALFAAGHLGSDDVARKIGAESRRWVLDKRVELMQKSLDALALAGTDVALSLVYERGLASKFADTQQRAHALLEMVASRRGLSYEELEDRLVPELGLDAGPIVLDYGARRFEVALDEQLAPFVMVDGQRKADAPRALKSDDATKAAAAIARFETLASDLTHVARTQLLRLERAMRDGRTWKVEDWLRDIVRQPLLQFVASRVVWNVDGALVRVASDATFADSSDARVDVAKAREVRVAHPLEAPRDAWAKMTRLFADYAIIQPFPQLARETFAPPADASRYDEVKGRKAAWSSVDALLTGRGWVRTAPEDGTVHALVHRLAGDALAVLRISPGLTIGKVKARPEQTIDGFELQKTTFGALHPRVASELVRDVATL